MDPKHVSLIKKAIRMIDYMRADLVSILGAAHQPAFAEPLVPRPTENSLYGDFDTATAQIVPADGTERAEMMQNPLFRVDPEQVPRGFGYIDTKPEPSHALAADFMNNHHAPVVDGEGAHFADCPCAGCEYRRNTTVQDAVAQDRDALSVEDAITVDRLDTFVNPGDVPEPDDTHSLFTEAVPAPVTPVITEYERRKRELHALHGTAGAPRELCIAQHAPLVGVACLCSKCRA